MECTLSITTCLECKSEYNIFEPYDIIILPLKHFLMEFLIQKLIDY